MYLSPTMGTAYEPTHGAMLWFPARWSPPELGHFCTGIQATSSVLYHLPTMAPGHPAADLTLGSDT